MPRGPEQPNFYTSLGISQDATAEQIKKQYRQHARELRPDINLDPEIQDRFKGINEAYETLSNPQKRVIYDRNLHRKETTSTQDAATLIDALLAQYIIKAFNRINNFFDTMQKPNN